MKSKFKISLLITFLITFSLGLTYGWIQSEPCRNANMNWPPNKFVSGISITQGSFPNGTDWVKVDNYTYLNYFIDFNTNGFHTVQIGGSYPNGQKWTYLVPSINPNLPTWCK